MAWYDYVIGSALILLALIIIAVVLLQEGRRKGVTGVIEGGADTFLSKGKAKAVDAVLARWTKWITVLFIIVVLAFFIVKLFVD